MSSSLQVQLSKAVAAFITAQELSQKVRCVHRIKPRFKATELEELKVSSTPGPLARELIDRRHALDTYSVGVGLQRRVEPEHEDDEADRLLLLADEIGLALTGQRLTAGDEHPDVAEAAWLEIEIEAPSADHLENHSVVTVVLTTRYQVRRAL